MKDRVILHCDLNNFYASVEMLLHPELKGLPVAVCGNPEKRHGIVLAKSNLAKAKGVITGEPIWKAQRKCPGLVLVPPTFHEYSKYSSLVRDIYVEFTPCVESFGLDECWLDVTGCEKLFGSGKEIAYKIKETVKERTGLTISVGVSFTKIFAKLGSDLKKPDAVTVIDRENYKRLAWSLPASSMIYVGRNTAEKLEKFNIRTIGDIAEASPDFLIKHFGKVGKSLSDNARGIERETVKKYTDITIPDSVGNGTTTSQDITNIDDATSVIFALSEVVAFRLRQGSYMAGGVSIQMKDNNFNSITRQGKLIAPTSSAYDIAGRALDLLKANYNFTNKPPLRMITITTYDLAVEGEYIQTTLFEEVQEKKSKIDTSIDNLRKKYGYNVLRRGVTIDTIFSCDIKEED